MGHVLLARVPTPPRRWGRCGSFPDEAWTPSGKDSPGCPTGTADSSLAWPCPPGLLGLWRLREIGLKERLLRASRRARGVYLGPRPQGRCLLRLRSRPQINKPRPAAIKPDALTRQLANEQGRAPGSTCAPRIRGPVHLPAWRTEGAGRPRLQAPTASAICNWVTPGSSSVKWVLDAARRGRLAIGCAVPVGIPGLLGRRRPLVAGPTVGHPGQSRKIDLPLGQTP